MSKYENTNLIDREAEDLLQVAAQLHYKGELLTMLQDPKTALKSNEERVKLHQVLAKELEKIQEKPETSTVDQKESKEKGKITHEHLLNKPNMTTKDKEGMQKSIDYLVDKNMDTTENLKNLDAIVYEKEYIEIGGVKRAREDIKAKPDGKDIYQHGDTTYFKRSKDMIKEQNKILAEQGMEIPSDSYYEKSLQALPGNYEKGNWYDGGNILSFITNMSISGSCDSDGRLYNKGIYGYRWSASSRDNDSARLFSFYDDEGKLDRYSRDSAFPVRPVLK